MIIEIIKMYEGRENLGVLAIKKVKVRSVKSLCGEEKKKWWRERPPLFGRVFMLGGEFSSLD